MKMKKANFIINQFILIQPMPLKITKVYLPQLETNAIPFMQNIALQTCFIILLIKIILMRMV